MENSVVENGVCSSESANGSREVWSSKASDSSSVDHLVVMVNGILGSATDWKFAAQQFVRMLPDKVFVHCSERNVAMLTLDGVDVMGERLAEEVLEVIKRKPNIHKISFVAHSVGGLVARYAIGRLYRPPKRQNVGDLLADTSDEDSRGTICGLEAINFITVATPHLGSRGNKQVPFLFGVTAFEKAASCVIHWIFRRTGRHLFLTDNDEGKLPLLKRMVEDGECCFMSALHLFKRRVVYSNVGYDHIVGWRTSSIRRNSELPKWEDSLNEKYPHVVYEEHCKACDVEQYEPISMEDDGSDKLDEELVTGLSRVSWEKVDVSFHSSRQRFSAHSVIQLCHKETGQLDSSTYEQGSSWAVEVGSHLKVCSIIVENLNKKGQMLVKMVCEECSHFLEIAEAIRSLGLTILKGFTEAHGEKTWICFVVEGLNNGSIHRMDILWSLVQILQPKTGI